MDDVIKELREMSEHNIILQDERDMARGQVNALNDENYMLRERITDLLSRVGRLEKWVELQRDGAKKQLIKYEHWKTDG